MPNAQHENFPLHISGSRFLVVGLGTSGYWAARWLAKNGARVTVSDSKKASLLNDRFLKDLQAEGIELETGGHREETFLSADAIVLGSGVPMDAPLVQAAVKERIPVTGEMELAARYADAPIIGVTGTNGKTTVTSFLGQMIKNAGFDVFVGGNIGTPLTAHLAGEKKVHYLVLELSSFQLDTIERMSPEISIILNISPDHLDRYDDFQAYIQSKLRIFMNQGRGQTVILNNDDPTLQKAVPPKAATVLRYGRNKENKMDAYIDAKTPLSAVAGKNRFDLSYFSLPGAHNVENLLAAILAGQALGLKPNYIQKTINEFKGLPHRLERVDKGTGRSLNKGIAFFNDSKATNVDAAVRAVRSFHKPLILIAGGRHKGSDYGPLVEACQGRVKGAVFMGEAAPLLAESFNGQVPFSMAEDMKDAVGKAANMAAGGDVVLLAPACSSFDMFENYEHRGRVFKAAVEDLLNGG